MRQDLEGAEVLEIGRGRVQRPQGAKMLEAGYAGGSICRRVF